MDEKILEEIKEKHMRADSTISLFFISIDTIFYLTILTYLGCRFKNFFSPKQMLSNIILVDVLIRLLYIYFNSFDYVLLNEICFTCLSTVQFFLLNNIFKKIFKDEYYDGTETLEIQSPFLFQYVLAMIAIISYAYYIQSRINLLLNNMEKKGVEITCRKISVNLVYLIALYFIIFYGLKLCNLFIENKLYYSYLLMAGDIFKEGAKFLLFGFMILIIKSFNKFTKDFDEFNAEKENAY